MKGAVVALFCVYGTRSQIKGEVKTQVEFSMDSGSTGSSCFQARVLIKAVSSGKNQRGFDQSLL